MAGKKLALNKETLRQLGDSELKEVVGGTFDFFGLPFAAEEWLWQHVFAKGFNRNTDQGAAPGAPDKTTVGGGCITVPTTGGG